MAKLIILYGKFSENHHIKQQMMIDGKCTCGYREYAQNFGEIIYLAPQKINDNFSHSIYDESSLLEYLSFHPEDIVWSVKSDSKKDELLKKISNKKIYYSCCAHDVINLNADISLVDDESRLKDNAALWFKGKDENYWKEKATKEFDYLLVGRRADKNELYFLDYLNDIDIKRKILWIGGNDHKHKIKSHHYVHTTDFISMNNVRQLIPMAKVGILFTEHKSEGFPQTFLEMTMCGVPVVYNKTAPKNKYYIHKNNCLLTDKNNLIKDAEFLLNNHDSKLCRRDAIENYSITKSFEHMKGLLKL